MGPGPGPAQKARGSWAEAARLLGVVGMAMALAPLLGPVLGGVLDEMFGWRSNFIARGLMGAVMLVIAYRDLGETNLNPSATFTAQPGACHSTTP